MLLPNVGSCYSSSKPLLLFVRDEKRSSENKGVARSQRQSWEGKGGHHPGGVMKVVLKSLPCESGLAWVYRLTCFSSLQGSTLAPSRFPLQSDFWLFHSGEKPCLGSAPSAWFFILTQRKLRGQTHIQGSLSEWVSVRLFATPWTI